MSDATGRRPALTSTLSGAELLRWYWLKSELIGLARLLDVARGGSKEDLTTRLAAALDGRPLPPSARRDAAGPDQLTGELAAEMLIPAGQRCSQELRGWFRAHLGGSFRFDRQMRDFIRSADGTTTLGDALRHWESSRTAPATAIDQQFEFNRFTRAWHAANPSGTRGELQSDWKHYRALPLDERERA